MKKMYLSIIIVLLLSGCKDKYTTCKINVNNKEMQYTNTGFYKIYYKKSFVNKIEKSEVYESKDRSVLDYFENGLNIEINSLNEKYGGFEHSIKRKNNKVYIETIIDLKKVNIDKMIKDKYLNKYYIKNNKVTLGGIKLFYESRGAVCE